MRESVGPRERDTGLKGTKILRTIEAKPLLHQGSLLVAFGSTGQLNVVRLSFSISKLGAIAEYCSVNRYDYEMS